MRQPDDDTLPLDDDTRDRLDLFAKATGKTPAQAAALLLHDLLWDTDFWKEAVGVPHAAVRMLH